MADVTALPETPRSLLTTAFTGTSTAEDVIAGVDLAGVTAIVTGGGSGLGLTTAQALVGAGADVTLAVRSLDGGERAAAALADQTGRPRPHVAALDLADPASIRRFVAAWDRPLHLLINNAGIVTNGLERTSAGWELQFATNHLGHFALTTGLRKALRAGATERDGARVVVLSSTAHMRADVDLDDLQFDRRPYDPQVAYAQSKTANSLFAVELTRRWRDDGIVANAVNPGGIRTGLQRNFGQAQKDSLAAAEAAGAFTWKTPAQGAATPLVAAVHPVLAHTGGHYLDDCQEARTVPNDVTLVQHPHGVKVWALDPASAQHLWRVSEHLTDARPEMPSSQNS